MNIETITYDDGLPISVIIPLSKKREEFFYGYVLPLIEANEPIEIIINSEQDTAPKKRNEGFKASTQPYVFFCDDDILLPAGYLDKLYNKLLSNTDKSFAYTGYDGIVMDEANHPIKKNYKIKTLPYDYDRLKKGNFISTMSLIKREDFIYFDENLKRLQDWDLWLTIGKEGKEGIHVDDLMFMAFYLDHGITTKTDIHSSTNEIILKHKLGI